MTRSKYLELVGLGEDKRRSSRQRLLKLDTYGYSYWMEKDFTWEDDFINCDKRDLKLNLNEADIKINKKYGTLYFIEEYMVVVGNYEGSYVKKTFEDVYKHYKNIY